MWESIINLIKEGAHQYAVGIVLGIIALITTGLLAYFRQRKKWGNYPYLEGTYSFWHLRVNDPQNKILTGPLKITFDWRKWNPWRVSAKAYNGGNACVLCSGTLEKADGSGYIHLKDPNGSKWEITFICPQYNPLKIEALTLSIMHDCMHHAAMKIILIKIESENAFDNYVCQELDTSSQHVNQTALDYLRGSPIIKVGTTNQNNT